MSTKKPGRNDPCPCGSGKKYKKCHNGAYDPDVIVAREAGSYPLVACSVNDDYEQLGLATVVVVRSIPGTDTFVLATFLCDIFCLGVKDVVYEPRANWERVENFLVSKAMRQSFVEFPYADARSLVLGSVEYARSLGFEPCGGYDRAKLVIEGDQPAAKSRIAFGRGGRPFYYAGPNDNYQEIFRALEQNVGKGNFDYEIDERAHFRYDG